MILYIAEKPSLGRAIADALPTPQKRESGCIRLANGDVVSWCIGHLLEQAEPHAYDPAFKQWRLEPLPIVPERWQLVPKPSTRKQLTLLRQLVGQADQLVHAGDPDREGQLLVDELFDYLKLTGARRAGIKRCLINDLNPQAVRRALARLRDNSEFVPLATSALARARADWLYGINLTRAYTLQGRKAGYDGVLSVGRVQTPLLGLVVRRDETIATFVPKPYYEVMANLNTDSGDAFKAKWQPSDACRPYQDEEGRVLHKALAENVVRRISHKPAEVTDLQQKQRKQAPPLPYSLSALQIDAAKRFGMSAQQVLDHCQSLYEKYKLITYPRSDCRHLPKEQFTAGPEVIAAVAHTCPVLAAAAQNADPARRSKAWNDAKVDAHHAIIPTAKRADLNRLGRGEQQLYEQIARHYLAQFYPDHEYSDTRVEVRIEGGLFVAKERQMLKPGWKQLFGKEELPPDEASAGLPPLSVGQALRSLEGELLEKETQPPKPFNDATLLAAMTGIARFVEDVTIRKVLKETDGLGTEATRAGIIELLFKRGFLQREGKAIRATEAGRGLIASLPHRITVPDMTAQWESALEAICSKQGSYQQFMQAMLASLDELITLAKSQPPQGLEQLKGVVAPGRAKRSSSGRKASRSKGTAPRGSKTRSGKAKLAGK